MSQIAHSLCIICIGVGALCCHLVAEVRHYHCYHFNTSLPSRLPKTRSMDNLLSAFENGVPLVRTSSDPNLNKHCLEGRPAPTLGSGPADGAIDGGPGAASDSDDSEVEAVVRSPPRSPTEGPTGAETRPTPCLTTQPLPSLALPPFLPHTEELPAPPARPPRTCPPAGPASEQRPSPPTAVTPATASPAATTPSSGDRCPLRCPHLPHARTGGSLTSTP